MKSRGQQTPRPADDRDHTAEDRDEISELHDRASESRDKRSEARDRRAESREQEASTIDFEAASDRVGAGRDRRGGAADRVHAADDRDAASRDRLLSAHERSASSIDELTGAHRRGAGMVELARDLARAKRTHTPFVIGFVDVDNLKAVNDLLGHAAGDQLLRRVVVTIRAHIRDYDLIVRIGGDEFLCAQDLLLEQAARRVSEINADLEAANASVTVGLGELRAHDLLSRGSHCTCERGTTFRAPTAVYGQGITKVQRQPSCRAVSDRSLAVACPRGSIGTARRVVDLRLYGVREGT